MNRPSTAIASLPIPRTDDEVLDLLAPFPVALAEAIGATVRLDDTITVREYQTLANVAANLDRLSPIRGLIITLILRGLIEGPDYSAALRKLKGISKERPESERLGTLRAVLPLIRVQVNAKEKISADWAEALSLDRSIIAKRGEKAPEPSVTTRFLNLFASLKSTGDTKETPFEKARRLARTFEDDQLAAAVSTIEASPGASARSKLTAELKAAADRAFRKATGVLKPKELLDQQLDVAQRFLKIAETLREQIQLRLQSIKERLDLQSQMFHEDLDVFVTASLDSVELSMRDLMEGRQNWAEKTIWEQFKSRGALSAIVEKFQPLKHRYQRLLSQWQRELDMFAQEISTLRIGVLSNVDPQAFADLLPSEHLGVTVKNTIDRAAGATVAAVAVGTLTTAGAVALGVIHASAVVALVANPVGATVAGATGLALGWKVFSNPEARRRELAQTKRRVLEKRLREVLSTDALDHDKMAQELMNKFLEAAYQQYAPLIIEARMVGLRAKLEREIVRRVLRDTRKILMDEA